MIPQNSYAEHAILPEYATFHIPAKTRFEGDEVVLSKLKEAAGGRAWKSSECRRSYDRADILMTSMPSSGDYQPPEGIIMGKTIAGSVHMPPAAGNIVEDNEFGTSLFQFISRGLARRKV